MFSVFQLQKYLQKCQQFFCFLVIEILEMLVIYIEMLEILEMLVLASQMNQINFKLLDDDRCFLVSSNFSYRHLEFAYKKSQSNHLKNVTFNLHIVFVLDDARPASSPSTRSRRRPASEDPCPGLGSAGLALGGATFRGAPLGEEPGPRSRRRP